VDAFDALGDLGVVTVGTPWTARARPVLRARGVSERGEARRCADARGVEAPRGGTGPGVAVRRHRDGRFVHLRFEAVHLRSGACCVGM
jgi:hypothetical protein